MGHQIGPPNRRALKNAVVWTWDPGDSGWWRLYHQDYRTALATSPRKFGPILRFDPHEPDASGRPRDDPSGRTAVYLGEDQRTCAAEVLWDEPPAPTDPPDGPRIARVCPRFRFAQLRPTAPIDLVRLDEGHADAIRALPELSTGGTDTHAVAQEWARAIYEETGAQGIYYVGAHNFGKSMVLWDKAAPLEVVRDKGVPRDMSLHDPRLWDRVLVEYSINDRLLDKATPSQCRRCRLLNLS